MFFGVFLEEFFTNNFLLGILRLLYHLMRLVLTMPGSDLGVLLVDVMFQVGEFSQAVRTLGQLLLLGLGLHCPPLLSGWGWGQLLLLLLALLVPLLLAPERIVHCLLC